MPVAPPMPSIATVKIFWSSPWPTSNGDTTPYLTEEFKYSRNKTVSVIFNAIITALRTGQLKKKPLLLGCSVSHVVVMATYAISNFNFSQQLRESTRQSQQGVWRTSNENHWTWCWTFWTSGQDQQIAYRSIPEHRTIHGSVIILHWNQDPWTVDARHNKTLQWLSPYFVSWNSKNFF